MKSIPTLKKHRVKFVVKCFVDLGYALLNMRSKMLFHGAIAYKNLHFDFNQQHIKIAGGMFTQYNDYNSHTNELQPHYRRDNTTVPFKFHDDRDAYHLSLMEAICVASDIDYVLDPNVSAKANYMYLCTLISPAEVFKPRAVIYLMRYSRGNVMDAQMFNGLIGSLREDTINDP